MENFRQYFRSMTMPERRRFAARAGTSVPYIENHLLRGTRVPSLLKLERLAKASAGRLTAGELGSWFLKQARARKA